jgi:callose synthase
MDMQIWYTIWSSFVGALVGLFEHLGEIRNVLQLRQRFQIFPSAAQFNLMPEEVALPPQFFRSWWVYVKAVFTRFKLRYGWAVGGVKEDSKQLEAGRFAKMWNQIVDIFREEDLISDRFSSFPSQLFLRWVCVNFLDLDYAFASKFFLVKFSSSYVPP